MLRRLIHHESAGGILLVVVALLALGAANSPLAGAYDALWTGTSRFVVNDILMAVFFFSIGLEIRREMAHGSLRSVRTAALPVCAALGGMAVPALIYLAIASEAPRGWGVPMATDIAFAIGILGLLGKRAPAALRVYLLALAVIDDIGAVIVIAIFYSPDAGVHPALIGVLLGVLVPARSGERLEHRLAPWVTFAIMPVFAFANAGVSIGGIATTDLPIALGITLGLLLGKPLGVVGATALAVRLRLAELPSGVTWGGVVLVGIVASIGFTMALFVAELAFPAAPQAHVVAKVAVICASAIGAVATIVVGRRLVA